MKIWNVNFLFNSISGMQFQFVDVRADRHVDLFPYGFDVKLDIYYLWLYL